MDDITIKSEVNGREDADSRPEWSDSESFDEGSKGSLVGDLEDPINSGNSARAAQSSLRLLYETEAQIIRRRLGGMKHIVQSLNLNQRQLARILMVDPSAVHRWMKDEGKVPPYIWRLLDYHAALNMGPESDQIRYLREQIRRIELELYHVQQNQQKRPARAVKSSKSKNPKWTTKGALNWFGSLVRKKKL